MLAFYSEGMLAPCPTPNLGGPPFLSCLQLLIQNIHIYPLNLEAISFIRNLRMHHAMMAETHLTNKYDRYLTACEGASKKFPD
jgi:hypothetical protein